MCDLGITEVLVYVGPNVHLMTLKNIFIQKIDVL